MIGKKGKQPGGKGEKEGGQEKEEKKKSKRERKLEQRQEKILRELVEGIEILSGIRQEQPKVVKALSPSLTTPEERRRLSEQKLESERSEWLAKYESRRLRANKKREKELNRQKLMKFCTPGKIGEKGKRGASSFSPKPEVRLVRLQRIRRQQRYSTQERNFFVQEIVRNRLRRKEGMNISN